MLENIRLSLRGIRSHKMRSALTMIGIIIGIAAIIIIVAIIGGASASLKEELVGDSTNTVTRFLQKGRGLVFCVVIRCIERGVYPRC